MTFSTFFDDFSATFAAFLLAMLLFGIGYNALVSWAHRQGYNEGYTWAQVVLGVAVVLLAAAALLALAGLAWVVGVVFALFAAAGLPMAVGDVWRYVRARRREVER